MRGFQKTGKQPLCVEGGEKGTQRIAEGLGTEDKARGLRTGTGPARTGASWGQSVRPDTGGP